MLRVDPSSDVPPFEQLRAHLVDRIRSGDLAAGAKLPTVRALAVELELAPNTIARAYRELETAGLLETRGRNGTFVTLSDDPVESQAETAAQDYAERMLRLGLSADRGLELVRRAFSSRHIG